MVIIAEQTDDADCRLQMEYEREKERKEWKDNTERYRIRL